MLLSEKPNTHALSSGVIAAMTDDPFSSNEKDPVPGFTPCPANFEQRSSCKAVGDTKPALP